MPPLPESVIALHLPVADLRRLAGRALRSRASDLDAAEWAGRLVRRLGGRATPRLSDGSVVVEWTPDVRRPPGPEQIGSWLEGGQVQDAVVALELLLSAMPDDATLLYNLGMAHSDLGNLDRAIALLRRCVEVDPGHVNAQVAIGVALLRAHRETDAVVELERAVAEAPDNPWARRNLAAALLEQGETERAVEHLRKVTEFNPSDERAWVGLGQALEALSDLAAADDAYKQTIDLAGFGDAADVARAGRSRIAQATMHEAGGGLPRMDAVMYCVAAMEQFDAMPEAELRKVALEIASMGHQGIEVNNPDRTYSLRSLPGEFTGLALMSYFYVAMQRIADDRDIGFDLRNEYQMALSLHRPTPAERHGS